MASHRTSSPASHHPDHRHTLWFGLGQALRKLVRGRDPLRFFRAPSAGEKSRRDKPNIPTGIY